jgi:glycogen synthase
MRVFMLGWEFPPYISGGLGTACYGLTKAMSSIGTEILFVLPRAVAIRFPTDVQMLGSANAPLKEFERVAFRPVNVSIRSPYQSADEYAARRKGNARFAGGATAESSAEQDVIDDLIAPCKVPASPYAGDMFSEVQRYAQFACLIARGENFDVVHAHDWMTFPAGLAVARLKGVPFIAHIHSTELDRSGVCVDQRIYEIERRGVHEAAKIIAVSHFTKEMLRHHYGADPNKVEVVYNAVEATGGNDGDRIQRDEKIVLFLGRITMQKGPDYFVAAARKVLDVMDRVKFIVAGSGDMMRRIIEMAAEMGIGHKVLFTGFLRGKDVDTAFRMADLYVMPSVSEPFGIAPLEALSHQVPVIISKQSGVSEVLRHALKVDFWDVNELADKIVAVLRHQPLARTLREYGGSEIQRLSWTDAAKACLNVYHAAGT